MVVTGSIKAVVVVKITVGVANVVTKAVVVATITVVEVVVGVNVTLRVIVRVSFMVPLPNTTLNDQKSESVPKKLQPPWMYNLPFINAIPAPERPGGWFDDAGTLSSPNE
jgi:hypothetical protein